MSNPLDLFRLDDKVVVVTGASSGLGVGFARAVAAAGGSLVLGARRKQRLEDLADELRADGTPVLFRATDVTAPEDCRALVDEAVVEFGRVDVLVNNAGLGSSAPASREAPEAFRAVIDVNLNGSYWMAQACGRVMKPGSSIVNIGSVLGQTTGALPQAAYASSKAAIIGLTRDLAVQWTGRKGIRVNALAPGFFPTEMTETYPEGYIDSMMVRVPAGRPGRHGARRRPRLPGWRCSVVCDRGRAAGRRRHADYLITITRRAGPRYTAMRR